MKIAKVSSWVLNIPFKFPLVEKEAETVANFVEIETDEGIKGHAMSAYTMPWGIREFINREIAPTITGMDPINTEQVRHAMVWGLSNKHTAGAFACASSLIDVALWDIKGKKAGLPIWKLLGGAKPKLPTYITFGLPTYTTEELIEVAKILINDGQTSLKMVTGSPAKRHEEGMLGEATDDLVKNDIARVKALREAVGPDIELMIDSNKNSTYTQSLALAKGVEEYDLFWFEDPVLGADPRLLSRLREKTTIPIAAGSTGTADLMNLRELLIHEAADFLQPNVRDIGGFTGGMKAAGLAQAFNTPLHMGGNWPHMNMHMHAAAPNGGKVEFHWQGWKMGTMLFDNAPDPINNTVTLPEGPGLGYTPKDGLVKEYAVD